MASTVDAVIAKFKRRYPECPDARALELFQDAHRRLLSRIQLRNGSVTISLVAGTREYALSAAVFKIHSAYLQLSAGSTYPLNERSADELDAMRWGWRNASSGQPIDYYVTSTAAGDSSSPAIGFDPVPGADGSVTLYVTQWADITGTETVPASLLTDNYYVYDMYAKWAAETDLALAETWEAKAERELQLEHEHIQNMQSLGTGGIFPVSAYMPTRQV